MRYQEKVSNARTGLLKRVKTVRTLTDRFQFEFKRVRKKERSATRRQNFWLLLSHMRWTVGWICELWIDNDAEKTDTLRHRHYCCFHRLSSLILRIYIKYYNFEELYFSVLFSSLTLFLLSLLVPLIWISSNPWDWLL